MSNPIKSLFLILIGFFLFSIQLQAEIYRWKDEHGRLQFGDIPPVHEESEAIELPELSTYNSVTVVDTPETDPLDEEKPAKKPNRRKKVVIYSAEWCGVCTKAKQYFRKNNIPFKDRDIDKSKKARKAFKKLNARGIPVIFVNKKRMNGFTVERFNQVYRGKS